MPDSTSVWLVTSGEYSDYSLDALFATEALAKAYVEHMNGDRDTYGEHECVEWQIATELPFLGRHITLQTYWAADGSLTEHDPTRWAVDAEEDTTARSIDPGDPHAWRSLASVLVMGTDEQGVHKAYAERKAAMILKVEQYLAAQETNDA